METRKRFVCARFYVVCSCMLWLIGNRNVAALSITVTELECVSEQVLYEGDTISGNFVAIDHDIFWSHDHPGIEFTVSSCCQFPTAGLLMENSCSDMRRECVIHLGYC